MKPFQITGDQTFRAGARNLHHGNTFAYPSMCCCAIAVVIFLYDLHHSMHDTALVSIASAFPHACLSSLAGLWATSGLPLSDRLFWNQPSTLWHSYLTPNSFITTYVGKLVTNSKLSDQNSFIYPSNYWPTAISQVLPLLIETQRNRKTPRYRLNTKIVLSMWHRPNHWEVTGSWRL